MKIGKWEIRDPLPSEICGCGCGEPLEIIDNIHPLCIQVKGERVLVNRKCYFNYHRGTEPRNILRGVETPESPRTKELFDAFGRVWRGPGGSTITD